MMRALSDPDTQLDQLFVQLGRTVGQLAPVADTTADLFANMATTFDALSRDPAALQATIERSPATLEVGTRSLRVQRPFLADFADLSRRLQPGVSELPRSLPAINAALEAGIPVLPRTVGFSERLEGSLEELEDLFENPNTLLTIRDLQSTCKRHAARRSSSSPRSRRCAASGTTSSTPWASTGRRPRRSAAPSRTRASSSSTRSSRTPSPPPFLAQLGCPAWHGPRRRAARRTAARAALHRPFNGRQAGDRRAGKRRLRGRPEGLREGSVGRTPATDRAWLPTARPPAATSPSPTNPSLLGGTYKSRELGIDNLQDVDKLR